VTERSTPSGSGPPCRGAPTRAGHPGPRHRRREPVEGERTPAEAHTGHQPACGGGACPDSLLMGMAASRRRDGSSLQTPIGAGTGADPRSRSRELRHRGREARHWGGCSASLGSVDTRPTHPRRRRGRLAGAVAGRGGCAERAWRCGDLERKNMFVRIAKGTEEKASFGPSEEKEASRGMDPPGPLFAEQNHISVIMKWSNSVRARRKNRRSPSGQTLLPSGKSEHRPGRPTRRCAATGESWRPQPLAQP